MQLKVYDEEETLLFYINVEDTDSVQALMEEMKDLISLIESEGKK